MTSCPHGLGDPRTCTMCTPDPEPSDAHRVTARFDGLCTGCGKHIIGGVTLIVHTEDGWICEPCEAAW